MIDDILYYSGQGLGGMVLGVVFFGGLWITVQKMSTARQPAVLFLVSVFLRMAIVLGGIWFLTQGAPAAVLACLGGFFVVRLLATSRLTLHPQPRQSENGDAT